MARGHENFGPVWDRFVARTAEHYDHIPSLSSMDRFQADWLRGFLRAPYDLRPNLSESMIRHNLTDREIETLVRGWGLRQEPAVDGRPAPARIEAGARLFEEKGCVACHLFGNNVYPSVGDLTRTFTPENPLRAQAPDLRHARDRLSRQVLERWIRNPQAVKPDSPMPAASVTPDEAGLLADYLMAGDPGTPARIVPRSPPAYDASAPVPSWDEVNTKVFSVLCLHCHEDAHAGHGLGNDGGPGNTGGFGFKGAGLSFESYAAVLRGARGTHGSRVSVFRPGPSGEPVLLERVRLRFAENQRDFILPGEDPLRPLEVGRSNTPRGMPLGLPAITDDQFSVLERWVRGGHPGPRSDD